MPPTPPRLKILSVGGNAISAFLSWRLSATNACDVTLVWKSGFETVAQYGITFKSDSKALGQERFKPRSVVRTPEEAAQASKAPFDYVLLCVKALPDVYDLASVIESVVSPQHTCILVNTTNAIGVESYLESRFPTNVVLSLVSGAELSQVNTSEFEHTGSTEFWVGPANKNPGIPASIQSDMAEALAMTLNSGQVDCKVSTNIRQQQFDRTIGPIAFQPASVLFDAPDHAELLSKTGARALITGVIQELVTIAEASSCTFPDNIVETTLESMILPTEAPSPMYQDYTARRPLEIETYLGSPLKLALEFGVSTPRIETLYALLHNVNIMNQRRPANAVASSPNTTGPMPRISSAPPMSGHIGPGGPQGRSGMRPVNRAPSANGPPAGTRRPNMNGYPPRMPNGQIGPPGRGPALQRRPSTDGNELEEFSHLMLYDNIPEGQMQEYGGYSDGVAPPGELTLRERELALRQRELALREQEYHMRRGGPSRRGPPGGPAPGGMYDEDDDEDGDCFVAPSGPPPPPIDAENFDMLSVTSRRTRKAPSAQQLRQNPELGLDNSGRRTSRNPFSRPRAPNRGSARMMADVPGLHDSLMSSPLMGYSSDRYGNVDRHNMHAESRSNSLTAERLHDLQQNGVYSGPHPLARRASQSPGNALGPRHGNGAVGPNGTNGVGGMGGMSGMSGMNGMNGPGPRRSPTGQYDGRPSPPNGMAGPPPRVGPPVMVNGGGLHRADQNGVSTSYPDKGRSQERSLTGSASASAGSNDSAHSARLDIDPSAHSSQSSFGPRPPIGVR